MSQTAASCLSLLRDRGQSVATAESITGGLIAATLASVPGASDVLRGGIVAYATEVKIDVLGIDAELLARSGVVSADCAVAMAERVRRVVGSDWGLSSTGVAGPDGQDGHPVGTVFIAAFGPAGGIVDTLALRGERNQIRSAVADAALRLLLLVASRSAEHESSFPGSGRTGGPAG